MRIPRRVVAVAALAAIAVAGGYLYAQPDTGESDEPEAPEPLVDPEERLSPKEMLDKSDKLIDEMKDMLKRVLELQQTARKQKDIIKLNCVNDKLLQLKQLLNIAEASRNNLTEAIAVENEAERYHQFDQIKIAHEKATIMRDEAEACIGEELIFVGPTQVDVDSPDVPDDPTTDDPFDFSDPDIERPGYASPFI